MRIRPPSLSAACAVMALSLLTTSLHADGQAQVDAFMKRMRDTLRTTMTQLQAAEADKVALQTQLAESDQKNKDLTAQIEALNKKFDGQTKEMASQKTAADKAAADLNSSIATKTHEMALVNEALAKWKEGYNKVAAIARTKEAERAHLVARVGALDQKVAEREKQNLELYRTGKEILNRYENFGLGSALLSREPFVGTARVKMQNQVQDYQDKLTDQKIKPPGAASPQNPAPPAPASAPAASKTTAGKGQDQKGKS